MKSIFEIAGAVSILLLMVTGILTAPEAQAFRGRGAAFAVGAAAGSAGSSASAAEAEAAAAQQQAAAAQQQAAAAQQQAALAQQQAAMAQIPVAAPGEPFPLGTVVSALPAGCTPTPVGGVNYYYCGGNFFKAVFEGNTLKYVTTKPK